MMLRLHTASAPLKDFPQGLKPGEFLGRANGTTKVVPLQSTKAAESVRQANGTTEVVPLQGTDELGGKR